MKPAPPPEPADAAAAGMSNEKIMEEVERLKALRDNGTLPMDMYKGLLKPLMEKLLNVKMEAVVEEEPRD